jgi:expansin (peptidoglycan-binding protein)
MRIAVAVLALAACGGSDSPTYDGPISAFCMAARPQATGEGTYYDADGTGNCSFPADSTRMVAAMNAVDYDNASWCGACLAVSGPSGDVTVRVTDQCPGCKKGDLDLSKEAFAKIAALSAGRVPISWHEVACDVTGSLAYEFKSGSSQYYAAIQVRNHRYPIAKLEAMTPTAPYKSIGRVDYNYFVASGGLGPGPYSLRVTDTRGNVVEDANIAVGDAVVRQGASQFPTCP